MWRSDVFLLRDLTRVEAHGPAGHVDGELAAPLHSVGQGQEGEEDIIPVRGVQSQLLNAGSCGRHNVLKLRHYDHNT